MEDDIKNLSVSPKRISVINFGVPTKGAAL